MASVTRDVSEGNYDKARKEFSSNESLKGVSPKEALGERFYKYYLLEGPWKMSSGDSTTISRVHTNGERKDSTQIYITVEVWEEKGSQLHVYHGGSKPTSGNYSEIYLNERIVGDYTRKQLDALTP